MPDNEIVPFAFEGVQVRALTIDGEPWFVLADLCRVLDIANVGNVTARLDGASVNTLRLTDGNRGNPNVTVVNEAGMYEVVIRSDKPEAVAFRRWLTAVVLPAIRKTGTYSIGSDRRELPQTFAEALREFAAEVEAHAATREALDVAQPRAEAWDAIASAEGDYSVGDAAKILARAGIPTGPQRLFNQLRDIKWTYRGSDGSWRAYAERVEKGYLAEKPQFHHHPGTGERVIDPPQLRVTVKGLERLRQRLHVGALAVVS